MSLKTFSSFLKSSAYHDSFLTLNQKVIVVPWIAQKTEAGVGREVPVTYLLIRFKSYFLSHIMTRMKLILVNILGVSNRCTKL